MELPLLLLFSARVSLERLSDEAALAHFGSGKNKVSANHLNTTKYNTHL